MPGSIVAAVVCPSASQSDDIGGSASVGQFPAGNEAVDTKQYAMTTWSTRSRRPSCALGVAHHSTARRAMPSASTPPILRERSLVRASPSPARSQAQLGRGNGTVTSGSIFWGKVRPALQILLSARGHMRLADAPQAACGTCTVGDRLWIEAQFHSHSLVQKCYGLFRSSEAVSRTSVQSRATSAPRGQGPRASDQDEPRPAD
jgi:hypothetical protein